MNERKKGQESQGVVILLLPGPISFRGTWQTRRSRLQDQASERNRKHCYFPERHGSCYSNTLRCGSSGMNARS